MLSAPEAIRPVFVRPEALAVLESAHIATDGLRSKSWDEFSGPGAPSLDFVFTVCDNAANETCPFWPGQPVTAHWGVPDPAAVKGMPDEIWRAFHETYVTLSRRIQLFLSLPLESLQGMSLQNRLDDIGKA